MITTVTTSTITSITTVTTMSGFGVTLGLAAIIALAIFLCAKELAAASEGSAQRLLARALDVSIVPLIIAFVMIGVMKAVEILA